MKTLILKSNHGNHTGFNRTWEILAECDTIEQAREKLMGIAFNVSDDIIEADGKPFDTNSNDFIYEGENNGFEYDLNYYTIVTQSDYDRGLFDGGHNGYATSEINSYFAEIL